MLCHVCTDEAIPGLLMKGGSVTIPIGVSHLALRQIMEEALLGEVFPQLRAVEVEWQPQRVVVTGWIHGDVSKDDRESIRCMAAEVSSQMGTGITVEHRVERCDAPETIPVSGLLVHLRREEPLPVSRDALMGDDEYRRLMDEARRLDLSASIVVPPGEEMSAVPVRTALGGSLLGNVFPSLREVAFRCEDDSLIVRACVDGPPSREDEQSVQAVVESLRHRLGPEVDVRCEITRCDHPSKPDYEAGFPVFARREYLLSSDADEDGLSVDL